MPSRTSLPLLLLLAHLLGTPAAAGLPKCTCAESGGCYHYLGAPVDPPNDPCPCPLCRAKRGACPKRYPPDWNPVCAANRKMECFLRRHAASWKLTCSERLAGTCDCNTPHPEWCPCCGEKGHDWGDPEEQAMLRRQIEIERRLLGPRRKFVLIKSRHFYLLTDIPRIKIITQNGGIRMMEMHEIAHVFVQRAEIAYREFMEVFGREVHLPRPSAIYLLQKERMKSDFATAYIGLPEPELFYGGEAKRIAGGYPYNCCVISYQKYDSDDWLHFQMRHLVGHLLASCWIRVTGNDKYLPRWAYAGFGHWLSRRPAKFREMANFCAGEGNSIRHSGEHWWRKIRGYAVSRSSHPIQRIFDVNSLGGLDLEMHIRAWSWFDLFLAEDRERFTAFLAAIREGADEREAMRRTMGITPEEFEQRWRDRVLGRRRSVAPTPAEADAADPDAPGAADRAAIRAETDPDTLAARIKSLRAVNDPLTAATLVPLLALPSERVREVIVLVLSRTTSEEVRAWLRTAALAGRSGIARAYVARVIGNLADAAALPALLECADDEAWLVRAHVARALGRIGDDSAVPALKAMLGDRAPKVRIAAMDALAPFGERAASSREPIEALLSAKHWQVRSAAAGALGTLGDLKAVEALIDRMEVETGRVRKDIREALKAITRDDLGNNPKHWRDWWEKWKERHPGPIPRQPDGAKEAPKGEHRYAGEPTYYGIRVFSQGVGYVVDTSGSMAYEIRLDPPWLKRHRRDYSPNGTKFEVAEREVEANLRSLDPRVRVNLYFFRSAASRWKKELVPASPRNIDAALARLAAEHPPRGGAGMSYRTNYIDAFRQVFDLTPGAAPSGSFGDIPDTIYFLTDGKPTVGDITDPEVLLQWFRERNRFARLEVNVITIGQTDVNPEFLGRLAEENGGKFVQVPEKQ